MVNNKEYRNIRLMTKSLSQSLKINFSEQELWLKSKFWLKIKYF